MEYKEAKLVTAEIVRQKFEKFQLNGEDAYQCKDCHTVISDPPDAEETLIGHFIIIHHPTALVKFL